MAVGASRIESLETRLLFASVHQELHRPPTTMATGDVTGDNIPDVVALVSPRDIASGMPTGRAAVVTAREAGSGQATGRRQHQPFVFAGDGTGKFGPGQPVTKDGFEMLQVLDSSVGHVLGDPHVDFVTVGIVRPRDAASGLPTGRRQHMAIVLDGSGGGSFGEATRVALVGATDDLTNVAVGDVNGDGFLDIVGLDTIVSPRDAASGLSTGRRQRSVIRVVFAGDGKGGFAAAVRSNPLYTATGNAGNNPLFDPDSRGFADVDGDGLLDVVLLPQNGTAIVHLASSTRFDPIVLDLKRAGLDRRFSLAFEDINGDKIPDAVGLGGRDIDVALGTGKLQFLPAVQTNLPSNGRLRLFVDANADGFMDYTDDAAQTWAWGNEDGSFTLSPPK